MISTYHHRSRLWPPSGAIVLLIPTLVGLTDTVGQSCSASQPSAARQTRFPGPIDVVAPPDRKTLYVACADAKQVVLVDADYRLPSGGFRPVRVTYRWQENGQPKEHVHVARSPHETYSIVSAVKPVMKSIVLELAE